MTANSFNAGRALDCSNPKDWPALVFALSDKSRDWVDIPSLRANSMPRAHQERLDIAASTDAQIEAFFADLILIHPEVATVADDEGGWTLLVCLCVAAPRRAVPVARALLRAGANPNACSPDGVSSLLAASSGLRIDTPSNALRGFLPPQALSPSHDTHALLPDRHTVCERLVLLLLEFGADPNDENSHYSCREGLTPLHWAAAAQNEDCAALDALLAAGANPHAINRESETPVHWTILHGEHQTRSGAVFPGFERFLQTGVDFSFQPDHAASPLAAAIENGSPLVRNLLLDGLDPNDPNDASDAEGGALLHVAAGGAQRPLRVSPREICEWLIEFGANVEALDRQGLTPLWRAIEQGTPEAVQALLDSGAVFQPTAISLKNASMLAAMASDIAKLPTQPVDLATGLPAKDAIWRQTLMDQLFFIANNSAFDPSVSAHYSADARFHRAFYFPLATGPKATDEDIELIGQAKVALARRFGGAGRAHLFAAMCLRAAAGRQAQISPQKSGSTRAPFDFGQALATIEAAELNRTFIESKIRASRQSAQSASDAQSLSLDTLRANALPDESSLGEKAPAPPRRL